MTTNWFSRMAQAAAVGVLVFLVKPVPAQVFSPYALPIATDPIIRYDQWGQAYLMDRSAFGATVVYPPLTPPTWVPPVCHCPERVWPPVRIWHGYDGRLHTLAPAPAPPIYVRVNRPAR